MTTFSNDYYLGYQQALSDAKAVVNQYPYHAGDGWAEVNDTCADIVITLDQKLKGNVAQMVTHRPAKTTAPKGVVGSNPTVTATPSLAGCSIVFTGKLRTMTRDNAINRNSRAGVNTQKAVNSKTDYLVVAEGRGSRKWNEAVARGVAVLTEQDWYDLTK